MEFQSISYNMDKTFVRSVYKFSNIFMSLRIS